jgi:hypothetical protein
MTATELKTYFEHAKNFVAMGKVIAMMTSTKFDDTAMAKAEAALRLLAPFVSEEWLTNDLKGFWKVVLTKIEAVNPKAAADLKTLFGEVV